MRTRRVLIPVVLLALALACRAGEPGQGVVTDTGEEDSGVRATLARACVRAGDKQTLTVRGASGAAQYVSTYADGETGRPGPHGPGYDGNGSLHLEETAEASWTVAEDAPPGLVVVYVNALLPGFQAVDPDEALTRLMLSFLLVGSGEECPEREPTIPVPRVVTDTGDSHPHVRATLTRDCVQAGSRQVLTVRAERGAVVTYNTIYANGENGSPRPNGGGYGGSGFGVVESGNDVELRWSIEKDAPPGVAVVLVWVSPSGDDNGGDAEEKITRLKLAFRVADRGQECP